jgi:glycosidase
MLVLGLILAGCAEDEEAEIPTAEPEPTAVVEEATPTEPEPTEAPAEAEEAAAEAPEEAPEEPVTTFDNLHVPSPEWQDQIIYFLMTDRFADGDPDNNDLGAGEYDPADFSRYNGGDLQGIIEQLDYIQELGATAVWITPPVSNQWWDPQVEFGGYHGYWAENFKEMDAHVGSLEDYQALSDALHQRGMYLIQDIVTNHTGNFFTYSSESGISKWDPADPAAGIRFNPDSVPITGPSQPPFDLNDPTDPEQQETGIYHWTPVAVDHDIDEQRMTYQLSDLDDLNTQNPAVRQAMRDSYGYWVETVGVDGFRIDTAKHVEQDFWPDFLYSEDPEAPGIEVVAVATGRDDFYSFGEILNGSAPYDDAGERFIATYLGDEDQSGLPSAFNYPLHFTINRVFAEGQPTEFMVHRLNAAQNPEYFPNPTIIPTFIDNHDQPRFLSRGSEDGLKQATMFLMTIPGVPVIYYGTEQGFDQTRAAMFAGGWASGGEDRYDQQAELYQYIQGLAEMRKADPLYTRGALTTLAGNDAGPGVLAYRRDHEGQTALIIFNTADRPVLMTDMDTQLPEGTVLELVQGLVNQDDLVVGREGKMTMELAGREGMILLVSDEIVELEIDDGATISIDTDFSDQVYTGDIDVAGSVSEPGALVKVIVNGNLGNAFETTAGEDGTYSVSVPISLFPPGQVVNTVSAYAPDLQVASENFDFTTEVTSTESRVTVYDQDGDDVGPLHTYTYPGDETFSHQMDIHSVTASAFGTNLVVDVEMRETSDIWRPSSGFDHVAFHIFIDLPGQDGQTIMPRLNAETPEGFDWDRMVFAEGWGTRLFSAEGADENAQGTAVTPAPEVSTDHDTRTVSFLLPAESLGNPETLEGAQIYVTTWDWNGIDAVLRPLKPNGGPWAFGGGDENAGDPIFIDDTDVLPVTTTRVMMTVDPAGDDNGPYDPATASGRYSKPTGESFGGQMDLRRVALLPGEDGLGLVMEMAEVTDLLGAPNGFDHVRLGVFLDLPGQEGQTLLPDLNAEAPEGFAWDVAAVVDGWTSELYGVPASSAELFVDGEAGTISLFFPAATLGNPDNLEEVQAYVTTWDWDDESGALRALTPEGGAFEFGGGDGAVDPLILDEALVGRPSPYQSPIPPAPQVEVTFRVTVPEGTPPGDQLFMTGEFNGWAPADQANRFTPNEDGTYSMVRLLDEGAVLEFRITRGSFANAEKLDPDDRFANRVYEAPAGVGAETVEIVVEGWWDQ